MIKIKIYRINWREVKKNDNRYDSSTDMYYDYQYCVYLFGILIHSVRIDNVRKHEEYVIFKGRKITDNYVK